jgi:GAF domain-containing protein
LKVNSVEDDLELADVLVELADTLVDDFDMIDFLHVLTETCVRLLDISAAGLVLADERGNLQVMAASTERVRLLELFQVQTDQGPCIDCFETGQPMSVPDIRVAGRWPRYTAAAAEVGFAAVHAVPMRLRKEVIGALSFLATRPGVLPDIPLRMGQALADMATIGLLQHRAIHRREVLAEQLQAALDSRIAIEQAKGVLAERWHVGIDQAFGALRAYCRKHNRRLSELAQAIAVGSEHIPAAAIMGNVGQDRLP